MKFAIYAGHGGTDPGAVYGGRKEKDYTLSLMRVVTEALKAAGQTIINNRTTDVDSYLTDKVKAANAANVDAVIEIHLNAGGGTGSEVYYSRNGMGKDLAQKILDQLTAYGYKSRGIKIKTREDGRDYFQIIRETNMPAVLVESCFLDCDGDMGKFNADAVGQAIAKGIMQVYGINAAPVPADTPPLPVSYKAGQVARLNKTPLYAASGSAKAANYLSGTYYLYDGKENNGRFRITNTPSNVGRTPIDSYVTGWIHKAAIV